MDFCNEIKSQTNSDTNPISPHQKFPKIKQGKL